MSDPIGLTDTEARQACDALLAWFKSQSLAPHQAMTVIAKFIALMTINQPDAESTADIVRKIKNISDCIDMQVAIEYLSKKWSGMHK